MYGYGASYHSPGLVSQYSVSQNPAVSLCYYSIKMSNIILCRIAYFFVSKSKKQMSYDLLSIFAVTTVIIFVWHTKCVGTERVLFMRSEPALSHFHFFSSKCDKSIEVECTVPVFYRHFNVKNCGFIAFIAPSLLFN